MIAWIDSETTGLVPSKERVLEVACVITDDKLNEIARYEAVTDEAKRVDFTKVDPYVLDMHFKNGLWEASLKADADKGNIYLIDQSLASFIREHCPDRAPQLGGSTISFDRGFIDQHLPNTAKSLHYRNIDVTTFNEMAYRFWPGLGKGRPTSGESKHRAMDDILESINVIRYYMENLRHG